MSKWPTADTDDPRYPAKYYQGYRLIRDPQDWNTEGRVVPIRRMPPNLRSTDQYEDYYRVRRKHRAPKNRFEFHPWISNLPEGFPPKKRVRIFWGMLE